MVQIRTPFLKQKMAGVALTREQAYKSTNVARLGHHNDCFLASRDDFGTYLSKETEYRCLSNETRYLAMGGETCVN
jgi:hypothetical protein